MIFLIFTAAVIVLVAFLLKPDPEPKAGVYRLPNKWYPLKYAFFRLILWLRKRQNEKIKETKGEGAGYGVKSRSSPAEMDRAQILPNIEEHPKAVDAVYFNGGDKNGYYFVCATARRQKNIVQTLLYLRTPGMGLLEIPSKPDTKLQGTHENSFAAGGLVIEPVEPMKKWRIKYSGKMRITKSGEEVDVNFSLDWVAFTKYFDFDTDMNPKTMADAICKETWSREYFKRLQKAHQTHYEQFGEISGKVHIKGYSDIDLKVKGVRDHSYGNIRDWKDLHRYAMQYCTLIDDTAILVGRISMPITLSGLTVGYIFHPDGRMETVSSQEFELYNFGDDGNPPKEMQFKFVAGKKTYNLKCTVEDVGIFYIGEGRDAKIFERFCKYEVNGVPGWGISEWDYRNKED